MGIFWGLVLCGCAAHCAVVVDETANNGTVYVERGDNLDLVLHSSYWTVKGSSRSYVLRQDGPSELLPPGRCAPGVGCRPIETVFTARHPGTAVVTATRVTCGEALLCAPDQRGYKLTVVVLAPPGNRRSSAG